MGRIAASLAIVLLPICASAQELTPGAYWPLPGGINILTAVNSVNWGDVAFDPSLPVDDAHATINTTVSRRLGQLGAMSDKGELCSFRLIFAL